VLDVIDFHQSAKFFLDNVREVNYINVMNVNQINEALFRGEIDREGLFPHLESLKKSPFIFRMEGV
jgi:hypothetical protein